MPSARWEITLTELDRERSALDQIWSVHSDYLTEVRTIAEGLAAEAAQSVDDGIRDLVDEDAEADAAVQAVLVRQMSERAMYAARRVADLESQGDALAFGKMIHGDGSELYVGRRTVLDGDVPMLVDWRARASIPFYRATPVEPMGLSGRRHLLYDDPSAATSSTLIDYSDEWFDADAMDDLRARGRRGELRGEAALLASVAGPTSSRMHSVVATIQAEQDAVVRAPADRPLLVQGGPGTGKTVVALHRAAYLLYDQREELAESGVLIVGPSSQFLRYISGVLPSLGESGVVSVTVPRLLRGVRLGHDEVPAVKLAKGDGRMVAVLQAGIEARQRTPRSDLVLWYGSQRVKISADELVSIFKESQRNAGHNDGARQFRRLVVDAATVQVFDRAFHNLDDARSSFERNPDVAEFCLRHFPPLRPEQALNDLLGSPALLASVLRHAGAPAQWSTLLFRPRCSEADLDRRAWSDADSALLDELMANLGPVHEEVQAEAVSALEQRMAEDEFAELYDDGHRANRPPERGDDPTDVPFELLFDDPYIEPDGDQAGMRPGKSDRTATTNNDVRPSEEPIGLDEAAVLEEQDQQRWQDGRAAPEYDGAPAEDLDLEGVDAIVEDGATVVELVAHERSWQFGHVIVDEAQELSTMEWRMVTRRALDGSITIVGDLAQRSGPTASSWTELLPLAFQNNQYRELTINYRSPLELDAAARRLLARIAPSVQPSSAIRSSGRPVKIRRASTPADVGREVLAELTGARPSERIACIAPRQMVSELEVDLGAGEVASSVEVVGASQCKGLEYDVVVLVEPSRIEREDGGLSAVYVAVTRATQELIVVTSESLDPAFDSVDHCSVSEQPAEVR